MANHTQDHNDATLTAGNGQSDVDQCDSTLKPSLGVTAYTFAEPNGTAGWETPAMVHHFLSRGVADGLMMPGDETTTPPNNSTATSRRRARRPAPSTPKSTARDTGGGWRVILVHGFTGGNDSAFQPVDIANTRPASCTPRASPTSGSTRWCSRRLLARSERVQQGDEDDSGNSTTWTWTLPANFPPGKYLRVTVDGGTVTQNGTRSPGTPRLLRGVARRRLAHNRSLSSAGGAGPPFPRCGHPVAARHVLAHVGEHPRRKRRARRTNGVDGLVLAYHRRRRRRTLVLDAACLVRRGGL